MGILVECPECNNRNSLKNQSCKCGKNLRSLSHKCYWIEYYDGGSRRRERTGHSKLGAENRLREVQTAKAEGRTIRKNKNALMLLEIWETGTLIYLKSNKGVVFRVSKNVLEFA